MSNTTYNGTTALVTGASAGIGLAYAEGLAARGADVVLVARRKDRLERTAHELSAKHGVNCHVVAADLSVAGSAASVREQTDTMGLKVTTLVNNAGFATYGPVHRIDAAADHGEVMVNAVNTVAMTHAYLGEMITADRGNILNISSIAAMQPIPFMAVYGATKAFILSFTEALWYETKDTNVRVLSVLPGATDTEFFDVVGNNEETLFGNKIAPSVVVDKSLAALEKRRPSVVIGARNKIACLLPRFVSRKMVLRISGGVTTPKSEDSIPAGGMAARPQPAAAPEPRVAAGNAAR
ncbi:MAG: SDR family oxidoreductase [Actinomycetota bacterium]|nr:SDR family oxidoreductase [Actinomycetota bacterium]